VFSTENLKRSQAEVSGILSAIEAKVAGLAHDPFVQRRHIRVRAIGRLDILPESERQTRDRRALVLIDDAAGLRELMAKIGAARILALPARQIFNPARDVGAGHRLTCYLQRARLRRRRSIR
jgi:Putative undecaprenyl diphosphate synthase